MGYKNKNEGMSPLQSEAGLERWATPKRHTFDFIISIMKRRVKRYLTVPRNHNITQDIVSSCGSNPKSNFLRDIDVLILPHFHSGVKLLENYRKTLENYRKTLANVNAKIPRFLQYDTPIAFAMLSMVPFV